MEMNDMKALAKSICKNAKPFGYEIKHSHMLEILARCDGAANFNTVAARQPQATQETSESSDYLILMVSLDFGGEKFSYGSHKDRLDGLRRLMDRTSALTDGVERKFYFADGDDEGDEGELIAQWDGRTWTLAPDSANVFGHSFWIGNVGASLEFCGEGHNGDYDPEDDDDQRLMRLDFMQIDEEGNFEEIDGSGCTQINLDGATLEQRQCFLEMAVTYAVKHARDGLSYKYLTGMLTWKDETWDGRELGHFAMPDEIPAITAKYKQPVLAAAAPAEVDPTYGSVEVADPVARVRTTTSNGEWTTWKISQNLTDRWGELNEYDARNKPLAPLADASTGLLERLQSQQWDELTFIARKDGQYGILFEAEYCSKESEESSYRDTPQDAWYQGLKAHADLVADLLSKIATLEPQYPGVQFALADEDFTVRNRAVIWAFAPDGLLTAEQRERLGMTLLGY